jgi:hypothetical protein
MFIADKQINIKACQYVFACKFYDDWDEDDSSSTSIGNVERDMKMNVFEYLYILIIHKLINSKECSCSNAALRDTLMKSIFNM